MRADNSQVSSTHPPEVRTHMYPTWLIVIFLLFFAVLAYGWFYWQRAKARAATGETAVAASTADAPATDAPATDAAASSDAAAASNSTDQP